MATRRVIIDTDPGIDDAQAILFALFCWEFQIDTLTTVFGNVPATTAAANVLRLLEMAGRPEIPVYLGAAEPLVRRRLHYAPEVHGKGGFGDLELPQPRGQFQENYAAVELARRVVQAPGEITILALGPLTNIALAIRLEPQFVACVREIIFMGGIVAGHGNVSAVATANVLNDSEAAWIVFNAGFRCFTMVGQDVTRPARMLPERRERLRQAGGEIAEFLYKITGYYGNFYAREQMPGFPVHDLLVMIYALRPALFKTHLLHVDVETEGALTGGMTVADFRPYSDAERNVNVCLQADTDAIFDWYEKVITAACLARAQGTNS
jgi:inosine-uridine nucleoside N-ribohydrolase